MEQMPEGEEQSQAQDPVALAQEVSSGLAKLADLLNSSQGSSDEDRAQMSSILENFSSLVEKKLMNNEPVPADPGAMPMEAGMTGKPMGPNSRM